MLTACGEEFLQKRALGVRGSPLRRLQPCLALQWRSLAPRRTMESRSENEPCFWYPQGAPYRSWLGDDADFPHGQSDVAVRPALCRPAKGIETEATMKRGATGGAVGLL